MPKRRAAVPLALPGLEAAMAPSSRPVTPAAKALTLRPGRGRTRGARCGVAPAPRPWEAVLLVVDTAKRAGWAIGARGKLLNYGEHDTEQYPELTALAVSRAVAESKALMLPVLLVLEAPYGGAKHAGQVHILIALGVAKERWQGPWREAGQAKARIVTVEPSQWRPSVLGSAALRMTRAEVRPFELSVARGITRNEAIGPDAAAAVCIHHWAAHAPKVGEALGKRATRASMQAWQRGGA